MPWYFWVPFVAFGLLCIVCLGNSYRHLRPEVKDAAHRLALRGPLSRQNLFTHQGWRWRLFGWLWAGCAMAVLILWGVIGG
jgi:hypothetical protein